MTDAYRFADFRLDPADRRLRRDGEPVELNARYFDALTLLVREHGQLVTKDRFLDEVWRGVPVTDEALTQCIRSLRRALGDDAAAPRFIATVPKHGYRFVAPVEAGPVEYGATPAPTLPATDHPSPRERLAGVLAAATGGGLAGVAGGTVYGLIGISQPLQSSGGATSLLGVMVVVCALVGAIGGAGVGIGLMLARRFVGPGAIATMLGGGLGGLVTGAIAGLVGRDVFDLLFGRAPAAITGPAEGALIGMAVGLAAWWGCQNGRSLVIAGWAAAALGAAAGTAIALTGGRLMAGSLIAVGQRFSGSRLRFEAIGGLFGEDGFGLLARVATAASEAGLFAAGVVCAMAWVARVRDRG